MIKPKDLFNLAKQSFSEWSEDKAARLAAALAFYSMLSLAPLLIIAVAIAGFVFGQEAAQGEIVNQIGGLVGEESASAIQSMIQNASRPGGGIIATIVGVVTLLLGASGVFGQLQDALNTIWEVKPKPGQGIMALLKDRFLSFTMVLGVGFLLLISLVISAALAGLGRFLSNTLPGGDAFWQIVNFIISFVIVTLLFALVFKVVPDARIAWGDVWIGAVVTAALFTIGRFAIGLYLGRGTFSSAYGAAGSLVVVLVWIYYSAQILFIGAEFTQVYANKYGSGVEPDARAMPVTEEMRAQEGIPRKQGQAQGRPQPSSKNRKIQDVSKQRRPGKDARRPKPKQPPTPEESKSAREAELDAQASNRR